MSKMLENSDYFEFKRYFKKIDKKYWLNEKLPKKQSFLSSHLYYINFDLWIKQTGRK